MREDQAVRVQVVAMLPELFEAQVEVELPIAERALADEEVGPGDMAGKAFEPARVTGVGDLLAPELDPIALGVCLGLMLGREGFDLGRARSEALARLDLAVLDGEAPLAAAQVVAHRLSTVRYAKRVLVMNQGQLIQDGDVDELINRPGLFSELMQIQGS